MGRFRIVCDKGSNFLTAQYADNLAKRLSCPGFDGGSILWEDVAHASTETATVEACVAAAVPARTSGASDQDGPGDHQGNRRAPRRRDSGGPGARDWLRDVAALGQAS